MDWNEVLLAVIGALGAGGLGGAWLARAKTRAEGEATLSRESREWANVFLVRIAQLEARLAALAEEHRRVLALRDERIAEMELQVTRLRRRPAGRERADAPRQEPS